MTPNHGYQHFIGVDPGLDGGIVFYTPVMGKLVDVFNMPTRFVQESKTKQVRRVDLDKLHLCLSFPSTLRPIIAIVERVHAMPGQGVASMFNFGLSYGAVLGVLAAHRVKTILVEPSVWKSHFGLSRDKKASIDLAQSLFPLNDLRKDGPAEAALLALYGSRKFYNLKPLKS